MSKRDRSGMPKSGATLSAQQQGDIAETELVRLSQYSNIIPTKVQYDQKGFDFYLQFPFEPAPPGRPDLLAPELTCKVQVKGVGSKVRGCDIRLDHWLRMVKEPIPWFVFIGVFDADVLARAFLVHIDERWRAAVLSRLFKAKSIQNLARQTLRVTWNDSEELDRRERRILAASIKRQVGDQRHYVARKLESLETLGYERHPRYSISFSWNKPWGDAEWERASDFAIGLSKSFPAEFVAVRENRFGYEKSLAEHRDVVVELPKVPSVGETRVSLLVGQEEVTTLTFSTQIATAVFPFLPPDYRKTRLVAPFLSLVFHPKTASVTFHFDLQDASSPQRLGQLGPACEFLAMVMRNRHKQLSLEFMFPFAREAKRVKMAAVNLTIEGAPLFVAAATAIADVVAVARAFGVPIDTPVVPLRLEAQASMASLMRACATGIPSSERADVRIGVLQEGPDLWTKPAAFLFLPGLEVGDWIVLGAIALEGIPTREETDGTVSAHISTAQPRLLARRIVRRPQSETELKAVLDALFIEASGILEAEGITNIISERGSRSL
jgi:hypothetical protein